MVQVGRELAAQERDVDYIEQVNNDWKIVLRNKKNKLLEI
jgi:hypothetical protein